jgi:hypothetical protein
MVVGIEIAPSSVLSAFGAADLELFADFADCGDYNSFMAKWLTDAVAAWRGQTAREPQKFAVRCSCGQTVSGVRAESNQTVSCPGCKATLFILSNCVYPLPRAPKPRHQASQAAPAPEKREPPRTVTKSHSRRSGPAMEAPAERRRPPAVERSEPSPFGRAPARKTVTPLRVVLLGLASVLVVTTWWLIHLNALTRAEQNLKDAVKSGEEALLEEDLDEAAQQFQRAQAALATLHLDDARSRFVRQTAHELTALTQLASRALHNIATDAAEFQTGGRNSDWPETFRNTYRDTWIVLDATVTRLSNSEANAQYAIEFPIASGTVAARVVGNLKVFEHLPAKPTSQRVIFAAQLADCRREAGSENGWEFLLKEETAFLWCTSKNFRLLTGAIDAETEKRLADQSRWLGVEP